MKLQPGTIKAIYNSQRSNPLFKTPIIQVTTLNKIITGEEEKHRYTANVSDGTYYMKAVFSSSLTPLIDEGKIQRYYLIKLDQFTVRPKENNNYLYIQSTLEWEEGNSAIGKPINIATGRLSMEPSSGHNKPTEEKAPPAVVIKRSRETSENVKKGKTTNGSVLVDIKDINPFQEHWMVKGRITAKTEIKTFTSAKGQGKLFSFELVDKTAQVKCVVFSENVDAFFPLVELNKVITINNATIRMANKKYSLGNLDYEIQLDKGTVIQEVNDDSVPQYNFKFMKIKDLAVGPSPVDVIAVIRQVYPVGTVTTKGTGEEIIKRDLYVVDETGGCRLTLWGPTGDREYEPDNSICLKGVRVGEYNGISLSSMRSTQVILNCDIPEAVEIMAWYHSGGKNVSTDKPTANPGQRQFLGSMKDTELEYATIQGSILLIKEGSLYYEACPGDGCNKKVSAEDDGSYRCGKCNYSYPNCNYRYMLSPLIGDFTGQEWISMFDEVGRSFFGMTAQQLKEMGEEDPRSLQNLLRSIVSKEFTMRVRIKNDVYNGEPKKRLTCMTCAPLDFGAEAYKMIAAIEQVQ